MSLAQTAQTTDQPLGDVARQLRAGKRPAAGKVYTNDNLPTNAPITILGTPPAPEPEGKEAGSAAKGATVKAAEGKTKAQDLQKVLASEAQKLEFNQRELNILEGEQKLQATQYYNDAGARLRDPKAYEDEARKYQESIAAKKQEIAARQQRIDDLKEAIRKAGLNPSQGESGQATDGPDTSNSTPAPAASPSAPETPSSRIAQP